MGQTMTLREAAIAEYEEAERRREAERKEAEERRERAERERTEKRFRDHVLPSLRSILGVSDGGWEVVEHNMLNGFGSEVMFLRPRDDENLLLAWVFRGDGGHLTLAHHNVATEVPQADPQAGHIRSREDLGRALVDRARRARKPEVEDG